MPIEVARNSRAVITEASCLAAVLVELAADDASREERALVANRCARAVFSLDDALRSQMEEQVNDALLHGLRVAEETLRNVREQLDGATGRPSDDSRADERSEEGSDARAPGAGTSEGHVERELRPSPDRAGSRLPRPQQ